MSRDEDEVAAFPNRPQLATTTRLPIRSRFPCDACAPRADPPHPELAAPELGRRKTPNEPPTPRLPQRDEVAEPAERPA